MDSSLLSYCDCAHDLEPGGSKYMWTAQLDMVIPLRVGGISMLTIGMVVLGLVTFLAMIGFVALCDRV